MGFKEAETDSSLHQAVYPGDVNATERQLGKEIIERVC